MPFIGKQDRTERADLKVKIRPEVIALVEEYAQFLESEQWYVVQETLRKAIAGDKEFQASRKPESGPEAKTPRSRKSGKKGEPQEIKAVA